jgi:GTP cyclohydrolase I
VMLFSGSPAGKERPLKSMPDIASETAPRSSGILAKVGMTEIEIPVQVLGSQGLIFIPGKADAFVSLDQAEAKGIHMSRLFLELTSTLEAQPCNPDTLKHILGLFLKSHQGLSQKAFLEVRYDMPLKRKALKSDHKGWRSYPIKWKGEAGPEGIELFLELLITYSSTCPCSAALSRQLIQENFVRTFSENSLSYKDVHSWLGHEQGILATPHGQRSHALVTMKITSSPDVVSLIDQIEEALGTPVQTAVKREDEQEFARLNAANLMFAEDAARKVAKVLRTREDLADYRVEVIHFESLHAHNASAVAVKGIEGGFRA